jgi:hypothetical protein
MEGVSVEEEEEEYDEMKEDSEDQFNQYPTHEKPMESNNIRLYTTNGITLAQFFLMIRFTGNFERFLRTF